MINSIAFSLRYWYRRAHRDELLTGSYYLAANTFAATGLGIGFWWLAARIFPSEGVGLAVVVISTAQLITTTAQLGLGYGVIRSLPEAHVGASALINSTLTVTGIMALALSGLALMFGAVLSPAFAGVMRSTGHGATFILLTVFLTVFQIIDQVLIVLRAGQLLFWKNVITSVARVLLLAATSAVPSTLAILAAFALPLALADVVMLAFVLPRKLPNFRARPALHLKRLRGLAKYSVGSYTANLLHDLPYQLLPHIVAKQLGAVSVAPFFIVWNAFSLLTTISGSVSLSLFVEGSHDAAHLKQLGSRALVLALSLTAIMALMMVFLAEPLLSIFGPEYALRGSQALRILGVSALPAALVYLLVAAQRIRKRLVTVNLAFALIAIVSLALSQFNARGGLSMIAAIWGLAQCAAAVFLINVYRRGDVNGTD